MTSLLDTTSAELGRLAARLRATGEGGLQRELSDAIQRAAEPIPQAVRRGLPAHMPARYAAVLDADLSFRTSRYGGTVTLTAHPGRNRALPRLNRGVLGHPVFGMRARGNLRRWAAWSDQEDGVTAGFFTGPVEDDKPRVREEVEAAIKRIGDSLG